MQDDTNSQPIPSPADNGQAASQQLSGAGGQKIIQPTPGIVQDIQAQQQPVVPTVVVSVSPQPPLQPTEPQPTYSQPISSSDGQMQVGISASQMGLNQPKNKFFDFDFSPKMLVLKGLVVLVILAGVFAALVATNVVALSQFKTIDYINSKGIHYNLLFYSKHTTRTLQSGNTQLVSKVSVGGKFPLELSISNDNLSNYNRTKYCSGFTKVFDVQNDNLKQKISVCSVSLSQKLPIGIYLAGIRYKNQTSIVTISQDLSGTDLSSQSGAQQSLTKFGIDPYQDDIKKILASIKIE